MKIIKIYIVLLLSAVSLVAAERTKTQFKAISAGCQNRACLQQAVLMRQILVQNQQLQRQLFDQHEEKKRLVCTIRYKDEVIAKRKLQCVSLQVKCKELFNSCNISQEDVRERHNLLAASRLENASLQEKVQNLEARLLAFQTRLARR